MNISAQSTRFCILGWLRYQFVYLAVSPGSRVRFRITLVILGRPHVFTARKVFIITLIGIGTRTSNIFFHHSAPCYALTFWIWFVDFVNWFDYSSAWIVSDNNLEVRSVHQLSMHKGWQPNPEFPMKCKSRMTWKIIFFGFMWLIVIVGKNDSKNTNSLFLETITMKTKNFAKNTIDTTEVT